MDDKPKNLAGKFSLIFAITGMVWFLGITLLSERGFSAAHQSHRFQIYAGLGYILIASILLYVVLRHIFRKIETERCERQTAEASLRANEQELRRIQALAGVGGWTIDLRQETIEISSEMAAFVGDPAGRRKLEDWFASVPPEDRFAGRTAWEATLKGAAYRIEHRIQIQAQLRWIQMRGEP